MLNRHTNARKGKLGILLAVLVVILAALVIGYAFLRPKGIKIEVTFLNTRGLVEGAPVYVDKQRVGSVRNIETGSEKSEVTLGIESSAAKGINAPPDCAARIVKKSTEEPAYVEIVNRGPQKKSLAEDATIEALEDKVAEGLFLGVEATESALDSARRGLGIFTDTVKEKIDEARDWTKGDEAQGMKESVEEIRADMERSIMEGSENAKEALDDALEKGKELGEDLKRYGREDLLPQLEKMMNDVEKKANELMEKKETKEEE